MTYVSHAVRSLRADPIPEETVRIVLTLADDAAADAVARELEGIGAASVRELEFGRLLATVDQTDLDAVCELAGVTAVETDAVIDHPS